MNMLMHQKTDGYDSTCRQSMSNDQERDDPNNQEIYDSIGDPICTKVVHSLGLSGIEVKSDVQGVLVSETTCSNGMIRHSRSSNRQNKLCKKVKTRKTSARKGKTVKKKSVPKDLFPKAFRKKRSCPCKQARSSMWGSWGNIVQAKEIEARGKYDNPLDQVENKRSHEKTVSSGNGRRQNTLASSLADTKETAYAPNNQTAHISLKIKLNRQNGKTNIDSVQSEVLKSPISCPTFIDKCTTKPSNSVSMGVSEYESVAAYNLEDNLYDNSREYTYVNWDLENPISFPGSHFLISLNADKDLDSTVTQDNSVVNGSSNCALGYLQTGTEDTEEPICKQYSDPGTSPDSEVINLIQDIGGGIDTALNAAQAVGRGDVAVSNKELMSFRKHNKSIKVERATDSKSIKVEGATDSSDRLLAAEGKLLGRNKKKSPAENRRGEEVGAHIPFDTSNLGLIGNGSIISSDAKVHNSESVGLCNIHEPIKLETIDQICDLSGQFIKVNQSGPLVQNAPLQTCKTMGLKESSEPSAEVRKQSSTASVSATNRRKNPRGKRKQGSRKSVNKKKIKEENSLCQVRYGEIDREADGHIDTSSATTELSVSPGLSDMIKEEATLLEIPSDPGISIGNNVAPKGLSESSTFPVDFDGKFFQPPNAWVRCDDCHKWRCISTVLADSIEATNCRWICSDNMDKAFSDCSTPQEKSNVEINRELELAEFSGEEDAYAHPVSKGFQSKQITSPQPAPWKPIVSNMFLHRTRKNQTIDEAMICQCKPPSDGGLGCGENCLNRILNIECVRGTCPCGDRCSNQQFQKRKYAKLESVRCGKKGYGLHLLESVSKGDFLIEYVGEVLDLNAYEARQREYASRGQRHFYFMTLNSSEVIDACEKGNLGRFINHSCNPNCETQKWTVNGEVCIGLFALRNIKKGEEVTFDYNYQRVFGAAAKRCVCGSSKCQGYIGGDPLNSDVVIQDDSDEEFPESVMVNEVGGDIEKVVDRITSNTTTPASSSITPLEETTTPLSGQAMESPLAKEDIIINKSPEMSIQTKIVKESSVEAPPLNDDIVRKTTIESPESSSTITATMSNSLPTDHHVTANRKSTSVVVAKVRAKVSKPTKPSCSSSTVKKKGKHVSNSVNTSSKPPQVVASKPKKLLEGAADSRPKGVEEKLNELLDSDGGISKRRDSTKGYLTLLFLTACSGDNVNGEATQSTRELSIILDALLKTKKRNVLNDIINKNGLQMLHNIMKQNRKNFNRIPIIRKLLKILEYLAEREILTLDLINSGPPCPGMESFRESILQLTRHTDVKVHQIAREFRNKWLSRPFVRRDNNTSSMEQQQAGNNNNRVSPYKQQQKQQQWNSNNWRPMEATESGPPPVSSSCSSLFQENRNCRRRSCKRKSRWDHQSPSPPTTTTSKDEEDAPPGFPPSGLHQVVVTGCVKAIFSSEMPVSYGVPVLFLDQLGAPRADPADEDKIWEISPSIPFHPFPPLPPYQSLKRKATATLPPPFQDTSRQQQHAVGAPCTSTRAITTGGGGWGGNNNNNNIGRRYFKQQKWNHPRQHSSNWGVFNKSSSSWKNNSNNTNTISGSSSSNSGVVEGNERQNPSQHY